jgi:hypothetical protein
MIGHHDCPFGGQQRARPFSPAPSTGMLSRSRMRFGVAGADQLLLEQLHG